MIKFGNKFFYPFMHKKMYHNPDNTIKTSYHQESLKGFAKDLTQP